EIARRIGNRINETGSRIDVISARVDDGGERNICGFHRDAHARRRGESYAADAASVGHRARRESVSRYDAIAVIEGGELARDDLQECSKPWIAERRSLLEREWKHGLRIVAETELLLRNAHRA